MDLTTRLLNGFPHGGDDAGEFIGANMGMGIDQNIGRGAKKHK